MKVKSSNVKYQKGIIYDTASVEVFVMLWLNLVRRMRISPNIALNTVFKILKLLECKGVVKEYFAL